MKGVFLTQRQHKKHKVKFQREGNWKIILTNQDPPKV